MYKIIIDTKDKQIVLKDVISHYIDIDEYVVVIKQSKGRTVFIPTKSTKFLIVIN